MDYLIAGLGVGLIHAVLYNPYDRALYLSIKNSTKFLDKRNWSHLFQGLNQSLFHRTVSSGLYFSVQSVISGYTNNSLYIGLTGGIINAVTLNPIAVIKYNCWGIKNFNFNQSILDLYKNGGLKVFSKGITPTMIRDVVFCCVYETGRNKKSKNVIDEMYNLGVGIIATVLASPFNYIRNIKYATPSNIRCKSDIRILHELVKNRNFRDLRLGWGTFRCGLGMMTGQFLYNRILKIISSKSMNDDI